MKQHGLPAFVMPRVRPLAVAWLSLCLSLAIEAALLPTQSLAVAVVQPCSSGLVALTFDDGPDPVVTPRVVDVLLAEQVPATFFVVGDRLEASPSVVRRTYLAGFSIGNHTYRHQHLTTLTDDEVVESLTKTRDAITAAGVTPSNLMRPPWGEIDDRVTALVTGLGLTPTLWNVATKESAPGITADEIVSALVSKLVPQRSNIVLMHDRGPNATQTLAALPTFIDQARALGYCFASLGRSAELEPPVPAVKVSNARVVERGPARRSYLTFRITLSEPTSRSTSVRVRTVRGTARPKLDYVPRDFRLSFGIGVTYGVVRVRVQGDSAAEVDETLTLRATEPAGLRLGDGIGVGTIVDDD